MTENFPKRIIICASGASVPFDNEKGLNKKLVDLLKTEYSMGLNLWYKYGCDTTFNLSCDWQFYRENLEDIKQKPLWVSKYDPNILNNKLVQPNTLFIPYSPSYYGRDSWSPNFEVGINIWDKGFYSPALCGFVALTLAIALDFKEIYLLGYDCKEINGKTHFYQDIIKINEKRKYDNVKLHYGVGKTQLETKSVYNTGTYNDHNVKFNRRWEPYKQELKRIKIINVSPDSRISIFPKITYEEFYKILEEDKGETLQSTAREKIREMIEQRSNNA